MQRRLTAWLILAVITTSAIAQTAPPPPKPDDAVRQLDKYPGLLPELGRLFDKFQREIQFPPPRTQSRLLPLLPPATTFYLGLSNYGAAAHQALNIFHQELQTSPVLRQWWQQGAGKDGQKAEQFLDVFYQLAQYLGDEIVISVQTGGREPKVLMLAEVRKPGLQAFLQQPIKMPDGKPQPPTRVFDVQQLAIANDRGTPGEMDILVRPDFVVVAPDVATLRAFNARLEQRSQDFVSTAFAGRLERAYQDGVTVVGAADLHDILKRAAPDAKAQRTLEQTGFADLKYLVWEHTNVAGQYVGESELSFTGPRRGVASWLGAPIHAGSLDFVARDAIMVANLHLNSPAQIFDDVKALATASNPNAFARLDAMQQVLNVRLKEDLLAYLGGEVTFELDNSAAAQPVWKAILGVTDAARFQQALETVLAATGLSAQPVVEGGTTYYEVRVPSPKATAAATYAFAAGYLIVGSSRANVANAIRLQRSGESLGTSSKFLAALPPGRPHEFSALLYQDSIAMAALRLRMISPQLAVQLPQSPGESHPAAACVYGEPTAIRMASTSGAADAGVMMVAAAVAIPNLLRSRMAANEASAVGTLRTVHTAQKAYSHTFDGYARDLAALGPAPSRTARASAQHADLIAAPLGDPACTLGNWCDKSGYRFSLAGVCTSARCRDYVATASPVSTNTGARNFCVTSDGVVRVNTGPPLPTPISVSQCKSWTPLR
jgi:type IV pilus assembly protein PilA